MTMREAIRRAREEEGAVTIVVALLLVIMLMVTALAVDVGRLLYERQKLRNTLDAAAQAGAFELPGSAVTAQTVALNYATANDPNSHPSVTFSCMVGSTGATKQVPPNAVGSTCYPGPGPYDTNVYPGLKCNTVVCSIPCPPTTGVVCNTISVRENRAVPFYFAPIVGLLTGSTGSIVSSACKGACGSPPTNPMDVVVVADRTGSMSAYLSSLTAAIKNMLQYMTPSMQYVALATINKSTSACPTGNWVSVPFTNNYNTPGASAKPYPLNTASALVSAMNCMKTSSGGTWLASPMKAAARYLLGIDANNLGSLPARSGTIRKAIIFETDGEPTESTLAGAVDLNSAADIGNSNGLTACSNLLTIANQAKAQGILIISVGFGGANSAYCTGSSGTRVRDVLAGIASNDPRGGPSLAGACGTAAEILAENNDGDYFYCAATGTDLAPLFITALGQLNSHSRFLALP